MKGGINMNLSKQELDAYDKLVETTFINIHSYAIRHNNTIQFIHFDVKNKDHLMFLSVARQASGLYGYKIQAKIPFFAKLFNKQFRKIEKLKLKENDGIIIDDYLDFMCSHLNFPRENVKNIYEEYYKRES